MKILNKKLVEEAVNENLILGINEDFWGIEGFTAGVNWAESQLEELLEEFGDYVIHETSGLNGASCKLLEQFLKERDEK